MLTRRLQILLDDDRFARLGREAERRGVAVAVIVRETIDDALAPRADERTRALRAFLDAPRMDVPADPADLARELRETRSRWG